MNTNYSDQHFTFREIMKVLSNTEYPNLDFEDILLSFSDSEDIIYRYILRLLVKDLLRLISVS